MFNEKVKKTAVCVAEKRLPNGMSSVRIYDKKMYCRAVENCQELTNQVFIFDMWKIGEMLGEKPEQHQYAVFFLPCCDRHIQERVAYAHKKIGGDLNGKV